MRKLHARSLEALVAGTILTAVLAFSTGCSDSYEFEGEKIRFNRQETSNELTVKKVDRVRGLIYEKDYVDMGDDGTVDYFTIKDKTGKTTYNRASQNPIDERVIAIAQKQYDAYLSKIVEMQTLPSQR